MTVNRKNFEAYLLDYIEGNLDPLLTADLMAFLAENPELENFLPDYDKSISLTKTSEYTLKEQLKKDFADIPEITPGNFDEFCIAACEGLLEESSRYRLTEYLARHPEKKADLDLYTKLKLDPDTSLHYADKAKLKRKRAIPPALRVLYYTTGIAASLALLVMLVFHQSTDNTFTNNEPVRSVKPAVHSLPDPLPQNAHADLKDSPVFTGTRQRKADRNPLPEYLQVSKQEKSAVLAPELIRIAAVSVPQITTPEEPPRLVAHMLSAEEYREQKPAGLYASESFAQSFLVTVLGKLNLWETAETALNGFNYITESKLSISKTTDENGKLTSLLIDTERFEITGIRFK